MSSGFAGYVRRTAASKERNAGGGATWQHLPVIYPCHLPALVVWPGPCSSYVCGVDGHWLADVKTVARRTLGCLTSQG